MKSSDETTALRDKVARALWKQDVRLSLGDQAIKLRFGFIEDLTQYYHSVPKRYRSLARAVMKVLEVEGLAATNSVALQDGLEGLKRP